jgi:hypothetical protein
MKDRGGDAKHIAEVFFSLRFPANATDPRLPVLARFAGPDATPTVDTIETCEECNSRINYHSRRLLIVQYTTFSKLVFCNPTISLPDP